MYRIDYTKLKLADVRALVENAGAPSVRGKYSDVLAGKKIRVVLDNEGIEPPSLDYEFLSETELLLTENGGKAVKCAYGALSMKSIVLFSHMIPGTLRGYTVVLDFETGIVTAEEMWFIDVEGAEIDEKHAYTNEEIQKLGFFVNREVERQIYRGYFRRTGKKAPEKRHQKTLHLDNRMVLWKDDLGQKRVFTYVTTMFSTLVEVGTPDGEDVITLPSDYLQIDDSRFFYDFGEVEYSGRLSVEVFDLFTMKKIGVVMGIDENDRFQFDLYEAEGKYLGQYAVFCDFNDHGGEQSSMMSKRFGAPKKGMRFTYRTSILAKDIDLEDVRKATKIAGYFETAPDNLMVCDRKMADSKECAGKKVTIRDDAGYKLYLDFVTDHKLRFRVPGGKWKEEEYVASQIDEHLVFLGFHVSDSVPTQCYMIAIDFDCGAATCIHGVMGTGAELRDIMPQYHFGYIEMEGFKAWRVRRHGFTDELLGRSFTWNYSDGITSQHIYNSPMSYSWTIFTPSRPGETGGGRGGFVWSSPCSYIKLRNDVYIMTWVEEKWSGALSAVAMNLRVMHDSGFGCSIKHDGSKITFNQLSAHARDAGRIDLRAVYGIGET